MYAVVELSIYVTDLGLSQFTSVFWNLWFCVYLLIISRGVRLNCELNINFYNDLRYEYVGLVSFEEDIGYWLIGYVF